MKAFKLKLHRDEILRLIFLKKEFKRILLKSIIKNQQIKPVIRGFCVYKIQRDKNFWTRSENICIITARSKGNYKMTNTSRHVFNKLLQEGFLTNIKTNNNK